MEKEKFKTLYKNDSFEIVQADFKSRNGKKLRYWYVDFGYRNGELCFIDFYKIADLKDFIKSKNLEQYFSKMFMKKVEG